MKLLEGQLTQIRGKRFAAKLSYAWADRRDLDAAHALVELANCQSHFAKNGLTLSWREHGVPHSQDGKLLTNVAQDNWQLVNRFGRGGKMKKDTGERLNFPSAKANSAVRMQDKRKLEVDFYLPPFKKYRKLNACEEKNDNSHEMCDKLGDHENHLDFVASATSASSGPYAFGLEFLESKMSTKNLKMKADVTYLYEPDKYDCLLTRSRELIGEPIGLSKAITLQKVNAESGSLGGGLIYDSLLSERTAFDAVTSSVKPAKKQRSALSIANLDKGFSFSIVHLFSAVRIALTTTNSNYYDSVFDEHIGEGSRRQSQRKGVQNRIFEGFNRFYSQEKSVFNSEQVEQKKLPYLTIHQIVQHVRLKPGDSRILETKEPLQDLIRGVLKIFSSKTAPPGAADWKVLTVYEKSSKSWSWIGPVPFNLPHAGHTEEVLTSEAWGLPRITLLKLLVDCFANWLKEGQEMLRQIGTLPPPPVMLMQPTNAIERFKDMRILKSHTTISPSCEEVRAYFRTEEALRYLIPDRAFSYTALDGRKSIVAPLTRCGGKPSVKAREHFMLKHNRPPNFTVLCLVRDAAARLPGSIGTRADICTLTRDSQYITEEISNLQVNQVVSGALDRLHYEFDPCVRFDKERHLWVYLHGEREEEDFERNCSSSSKIRKRVREMHWGDSA
ncbi:unnamed protein product [Ilex paraguariensis]|uniref:Nuclear factor related to kappa-B-binding protein second winged helix domain-containing protein n=1 Tax=Ilex paraguariensis TaxID=185542 RepID=A0ABC8TD74_9AQUA